MKNEYSLKTRKESRENLDKLSYCLANIKDIVWVSFELRNYCNFNS